MKRGRLDLSVLMAQTIHHYARRIYGVRAALTRRRRFLGGFGGVTGMDQYLMSSQRRNGQPAA